MKRKDDEKKRYVGRERTSRGFGQGLEAKGWESESKISAIMHWRIGFRRRYQRGV